MEPEDFRFKPRTYLHFDAPVSEATARALGSNPERVASHSFYPFLGYTITTQKVVRKDGRKVPKTKNREIRIAAHADAAIYSYYSQILSDHYEEELARRELHDVPTAFRSSLGGRTNIEFAGEVFRFVDSHRDCVALAFDVEQFFDTLDHDYLKDRWKHLLGENRLPSDHFAVYKSLTSFSWVSRDDAYDAFSISQYNPKHGGRRRICTPTEFRSQVRGGGLIQPNPRQGKGIPQGSPISAVLSNIYMLEFDAIVSERVRQVGGLYRRYCDDIMVVVPLSRGHETEAFVYGELESASLTAHPDKTKHVPYQGAPGTPSNDILQYLGFTFDGVNILLRQGSIGRYYGKMRKGVSLAKQTQRKYNQKEEAAGLPLSPLKKRKLHLQYSYLISRRTKRKKGNDPKANGNFLTYAYKAARRLNSPAIKRQVRNHWKKLNEEIGREIGGQLRDP